MHPRLFDRVCRTCKHVRDPEMFHYAILGRYKSLKANVICNKCLRKEFPNEAVRAKSYYYCQVWKLMKIGYLYNYDLKWNDRMRREKIYPEMDRTYKAHLASRCIDYPTDDQEEAYIYTLMAHDTKEEVERLMWELWAKR